MEDNRLDLNEENYIAVNDASNESIELSDEAVSDCEQQPVQPAAPQPDPGLKYITKKAFALTIIAVMIASTFLGSLGSVAIMKLLDGGSDPGAGYANLTVGSEGKTLSTQEIIAKNIDAVVEINTETVQTTIFGQQALAEGAGSGVVMSEDGYIATNNHVISGAKKITVILHNGKSYQAKLVGRDSDNDIAVIKIDASKLTPATVGDSSKLTVGDQSVVIGNPLGRLGGTATEGIISALQRRLTLDSGVTLDLLQTDAAINQGNSGGGLFNSRGELVGVVVAKSAGTGIEGLAYAIPINSVASIIDDMIKKGVSPGKPSIGISIRDINEEEAEYYELEGPGVYVVEVTSENAEKAGLKVGDRLVTIDGKSFDSSSDFIARVRKHKIGDTVKLTVSRDGFEIDKEIKLTELVETVE